MSVWKYPVYRDDVLENICKSFPERFVLDTGLKFAADFYVEDFGNHVVPKNLKPGKLIDQIYGCEDDAAVKLRDLYECFTEELEKDDAVLNKFSKLKDVQFGLRCVYKLAYRYIVNPNKRKTFDTNKQTFIRNFFTIGEMASYMGSKRASEFAKEKYEKLEEIIQIYHNFRMFIVQLKSALSNRALRTRIKTDRSIYKELDDFTFKEPLDNCYHGFDYFAYAGNVYMTDDDYRSAYILTSKDLDRLYQVVRGFCFAKIYSETFSADSDRISFELLLKIFCKSLVECARPNELCRAWDVIANICFAPTDVSMDARNLLIHKYEEEKLKENLNLGLIENVLSKVKIREKIDMLNIRKCLPTPDFDYFGAATRQEKIYEKLNPFLAEGNETEQEFKTYYKYMMVRAYQKKHGYLPGNVKADAVEKEWHDYYPQIKTKDLPYNFVDDLELEGVFRYKSVGKDIMQLCRDSAIIPANIEKIKNGYMMNREEIENKNMIADIFKRTDDINTNNIDMRDVIIDVKAEDKPEAKKPNGRWFFEANTDARIKHSEYEMNHSEYVKHMPGCAIGLEMHEMEKKINKMTEGVGEMDATQNLLISFDLSKFSPHYPGRLHQIIDEVNAELYGMDFLKHDNLIHHKGSIHYFKKSIHHSFEKPFADLEGFSGKLNTSIHATLMGLAVHKCREKNIMKQGVKLATFIDDGLMCVKISRDNYEKERIAIMKEIDRVYKAFGFEISYDKTFQSKYFCVFLHNFLYNGRRLTGGLKALLKMDNYNEGVVDLITDDINLLEAKTRAVLESGADHRIVYFMYSYMVSDILQRWNKAKVRILNNHIPWIFAPVSLGGLGAKTLLQLCGSMEDNLQTGWLSVIFQTKRRIPSLVRIFQNIINQKMSDKKIMDRFFSSKVCRIADKIINSFRLQKIVEKYILNSPDFRKRLNLVGRERSSLLDVTPAVGDGSVPAVVLGRVYNATIVSKMTILGDKLLRSRTAIKIVGKRAWNKVKYANQRDADDWFKKVF